MSNRVALVTGGAQGIGEGISRKLGAEGFRVAIADLNLEVAQQTAKEIVAAGGEGGEFGGDVKVFGLDADGHGQPPVIGGKKAISSLAAMRSVKSA